MKVQELEVEKITIGDRAREDMGNVKELAASLKEKGFIQPITVDQDFNLVTGGRRFAAALELGLKKIPAVVRKITSELDARELELFENLHRKELTWQEQTNLTAQIHSLMKEQHGDDWSLSKTAKLLDKGKSTIDDAVNLAEAMKLVPALANEQNADKARRKFKAALEQLAVNKVLEQAKEAVAGENSEQTRVHFADTHYLIGDAIEGMAEMTDSICHFAEVDPPYAIDLKKERGETSTGYEHYNEVSKDDYPDFIRQTAEQVYRVLDINSFCVWWHAATWGSMVLSTLREVGFDVDDIPAIWYKQDSGVSSNNPDAYLARGYEPFFVCRKGRPLIRQRGHSNVFPHAGVDPKNRIHLTERPLSLMQDILQTFCYPKARIIVPFLGSGNTVLAAYREGMVAFGWDLSEQVKKGFLRRVNKEFPEEEGEEG